jgi:glutathione S-transferase
MTRFSLHGMWPSGPTYKVALMLRLTDTPHDYDHIDLQAGAQREEAYLEKNPYGQVPVLEDREAGVFISQSSVILDYLAAETRQFNGKDRLERVKARQWQFWGAGGLANGIYRTRAAKLGFFKFADDVIAANEQAGIAALEQLDGFLKGRDWLVGEAATIADLDLYGITAYAPQAQIDLAPYANVQRWMTGVEALPRFADVMTCVPKESVKA